MGIHGHRTAAERARLTPLCEVEIRRETLVPGQVPTQNLGIVLAQSDNTEQKNVGL
jgi:hypothetical protein